MAWQNTVFPMAVQGTVVSVRVGIPALVVYGVSRPIFEALQPESKKDQIAFGMSGGQLALVTTDMLLLAAYVGYVHNQGSTGD